MEEPEEEEDEGAEDKSEPKTPPPRPAASDGRKEAGGSSAKTVTFNTDAETNYAEQTPLMFSRCSSLESLGSCIDQHQVGPV